MENMNRLGLQFFAEEESASNYESSEGTNDTTQPEKIEDIDFSVAFEGRAEADAQETTTENGEETVEPAKQPPVVEQEIPNDVWKQARIKAEREADAKIAKERELFANSLAEEGYLGKEDPYNHTIIRTKDEQNAYMKAVAEDSLTEAGLPIGILERLINENPAIQMANTIIAQTDKERSEIQLNEQIKKITELDPSIKTIEDIMNLPNREDFDKLVIDNKYSLVDAYKIVNFDKLMDKKTSAIKQQAINSVNGKSHLVSSAGTGADDVVVPAETMRLFKEMVPTASMDEIKRYYAKSQKKQER